MDSDSSGKATGCGDGTKGPVKNLRESLDSGRVLLADGATGTMLQQAGLPMGEAPERWTLENPDAIRGLVADYIAAGSDIVYTNTFGANRLRLRRAGLEDQLETINRRAAALAREAVTAADRQVFLVASIGPAGEMLDPYGDLSAEEAAGAFGEQARILAEAGVDGFACETFTALEEALLCLGAVRKVADTRPVFASMSFEEGARTLMGVRAEDAGPALFAAGADVVGANCSVGPEVVEAVLRALSECVPGRPLLAKPNAGLPVVEDGAVRYPVTPGQMGEFALRAATLGAVVIGGCCGSTPAHIGRLRGVFPG